MVNYDKMSFLSGLINNLTVRTTTPTGLEDFYYTENEDGTFTIFGWKGTLNGKASSVCAIPDSPLIIVQLTEMGDFSNV